MTKDESFRSSMQGGWLNLISPCAALAITVIGEKTSVPAWMASLLILCIWFTGFLLLIRIQFKRRRRNSDVFKAFWTTTLFGFVLLAALLFPMYFIR